MGVSSRAADVIEPGNGDLLMPDRNRQPRAMQARDVEDACFETIGAARGRSSRPHAAETSSVFKSRLTQSPAHGPFPPDFANDERASRQGADRNGRLSVFGGEGAALSSGGPRFFLAASGLVLAMGVFAAAGFWAFGDDKPTPLSDARAQASVSAPPAARALPIPLQTPLLPDPVATSSIPDGAAGTTKGGYTTPVPRPARIERAGSILMIRPGGG